MGCNGLPVMAWLLLLFHLFVIVHSKDFVRSRRDTAMENVEAIYNHFIKGSKGKASFYGEYPGGALCSLDPPPPLANQPNWVKIAVSKDYFQGTLGCGMCVELSGFPSTTRLKGPTPVNGVLKGMVYDLCGSCKQGDVDLYVPGNADVRDITMKAIDCPSLKGSVNYIQFRFTGSNEYYFKVQVRNTRIPVAGMEVFNTVTNDWYCLKKNDENYFTSEGLGKVTFPMKVRVTSITNEKLETTITTLKNDESFPSDIQFSGIMERGGSPTGIQCYGQGHKSTKDEGPEVDEKFCAGKEDGIYADPNDCSAFYECANGKSYKQYCANGLKFNALTGKCDSPEKVNCDVKVKYVKRAIRSFSEDIETHPLEPEDISLRNIGVHRERKTSRNKKHHHHHLHKRSKFHSRHKRHKLHGKRLRLEASRTKVHHATKRTAGKGVNLKVKVQFKGPNLSGTLVSNDPMNPNEGDITLSAVPNAEQGYITPYHGQNSEEQTTTAKSTQENPVSPLNNEDNSFQGQSNEERHHVGDLIVQATQMQDGTLQTSTSVRPKEIADNNNKASSDSSKIEESDHPTKIESLLKNSFETKPQTLVAKESKDGIDFNASNMANKMQQNTLSKNSTGHVKDKTNKTESNAIQGIMETINMLKEITKGNATKSDKNSNNKNVGTLATSILHSEKSKEAAKAKKPTKSAGNVLSSPKSNSTVNDNKEPQQSKQKTNGGILFVISKNNTKEDKEKLNDNKLIIMPNIGIKVHGLDDTSAPKYQTNKVNDQKPSGVTPHFTVSFKHPSHSTSETQNQSLVDSSTNSKEFKNKDTNSTSSPDKTSLSGLIGMIGNLVKSKLKNRFNQTTNGAKVPVNAKNDTTALEDVNRNITIGKINISLQTAEQDGSFQNGGSGQGTLPRYHPTIAMKPLTATIHVNKPFQAVGVPISPDQKVLDQGFSNGSAISKLLSLKEKPSNIDESKESLSKNSEDAKTNTLIISARNDTLGAKSDSKSAAIPIMRIRLKGPSNKVGEVSISKNQQDNIFSKKEKQNSIFVDSLRNVDKNEEAQKVKPLHTTTVIIRQYHKDPKPVNYGSEDIFDTLPMKGSDNFDANGNMKLPSPVISMNDAQNLLEGDKALIDNTAMQNALYNPDANAFSDHKEDSLKSSQQNTLTENDVGQGGDDDFAQALQRQDDQPKHLQKMAAKENHHSTQTTSSLTNEKAPAFQNHRFKEIEKVQSSKFHAPVMSHYMNDGSHPMAGMHNGNYMNMPMGGMNDAPMGMNVGNGIQMSGGMNGMPTGKQGGGMSPVEMQPISGSEEDVNKGMKQMLTNMQDMALKQIQSKYPGMPITIKPDDSEESEEDHQQQTESGAGQEDAGSTPNIEKEVFGKHKQEEESKTKDEPSSQDNTAKPGALEGSGSILTPKFEEQSASGDSSPKQEEKKEESQSAAAPNGASNKQNQANKPNKDNSPAKQQDNSIIAVKNVDPKELCRVKPSGVYASDEDPSKFIICYNGVTEERQCSNGMVFNPREKVCEPSDSTLASKMEDESKSKNKAKDKTKQTKGKAKDLKKGKKGAKTKKES